MFRGKTAAIFLLFMMAMYLTTICTSKEDKAKKRTQGTSETAELGKAINLPKINILEDFKEREASIFETFPTECFKKEKLNISKSYYDYFESTKAFFSKLATQTGLEASLESTYSLGVTLNSITRSTSEEESNLSGISLTVESLVEKLRLDKDCLNDEKYNFKKNFEDDLKILPLKINQPWLKNSWRKYHDFFDKYGTHVISSVTRGSKIKQMSFTKSSKSYSERELQVKACLSLAGPSSFGKVGVSACTNVTNSEASKASDMSTTDKRIVRGGRSETRNKLLHDMSKELIQQLLNEASETHSSVQQTFRAVWRILQSRFTSGSDNYRRALNLQYYYLGYLNYGCFLKESKGVILQKFDYTKHSNDEHPEFECSLAKEGCHRDDDCSYRFGPWCACRGDTCVRYVRDEKDSSGCKVSAYPNVGKFGDLRWFGCDWYALGTYCGCYNKNLNERKVVWPCPTKDVASKKAPRHHGHHHKANYRGLIEKEGSAGNLEPKKLL